MKNLTYTKRVFLLFGIICTILLLLSLIGLIFGNYYITTSFAFGFICAGVNLFLLVKSADSLNPANQNKGGQVFFLFANVLRTLIAFIAIGLSALIIYLTIGENDNKMLYLSILGSGAPFLIMAMVTAIVRPDEEKGN